MHVKRIRRFPFDTRSLALFTSLALGSGLAAAQFSIGPTPAAPGATTPAAQAIGLFHKLDADGNGSISRKEATDSGGFLLRNFDALDTNRDGVLSRAEFDRSPR